MIKGSLQGLPFIVFTCEKFGPNCYPYPRKNITVMPEKTVVVTGATSGIGKATAELFLKNGHKVIAVGRKVAELEGLSELNNGKLDVQTADLLDVSQIERLSARIVEQCGGVDVLVNAAGTIKNGTIENT